MEMIKKSLLRAIAGLCVTACQAQSEKSTPFTLGTAESVQVLWLAKVEQDLTRGFPGRWGPPTHWPLLSVCPACLQTAKDLFHHQGDFHHSGFADQINIYNSLKDVGRANGWAHFKQGTKKQVGSWGPVQGVGCGKSQGKIEGKGRRFDLPETNLPMPTCSCLFLKECP